MTVWTWVVSTLSEIFKAHIMILILLAAVLMDENWGWKWRLSYVMLVSSYKSKKSDMGLILLYSVRFFWSKTFNVMQGSMKALWICFLFTFIYFISTDIYCCSKEVRKYQHSTFFQLKFPVPLLTLTSCPSVYPSCFVPSISFSGSSTC